MTAPRFRLYLAQSLDGYIADERGGVDWLTAYGEPEGYAEFLAETGAIVMGRRSFDQMLTFGPWPYGERRTVVLTHHPLPQGAPGAAEAWSGADVEPLAQDLRTTTRGDVWLFGGGSAMGPFIDADLVDTIEIAIIPIVLGAGIRLFDAGLPTRRYDLRSVEHAAAGYALLKMARRRADTAPG
jgi:dihydrofolate reductase